MARAGQGVHGGGEGQRAVNRQAGCQARRRGPGEEANRPAQCVTSLAHGDGHSFLLASTSDSLQDGEHRGGMGSLWQWGWQWCWWWWWWSSSSALSWLRANTVIRRRWQQKRQRHRHRHRQDYLASGGRIEARTAGGGRPAVGRGEEKRRQGRRGWLDEANGTQQRRKRPLCRSSLAQQRKAQATDSRASSLLPPL